MSKKFFKMMLTASTIAFTLLGVEKMAWAMWEELEPSEKLEITTLHMVGHRAMTVTNTVESPHYGNIEHTYQSKKMKWCPTCNYLINDACVKKSILNRLEILEAVVNKIKQESASNPIPEIQEVNNRLKILEEGFKHHKLLTQEIQQQEREEYSRTKQEEEVRFLSVKEEKAKVNIILKPDEEGKSLLSTVKSLREIKLQHEKTIKKLSTETEELTDTIKEMMKVIGIKTDDFSDCSGNIFAKKCLERLRNVVEDI